MGSITFIEHNGTQHIVDIGEGKSLMQIAVENSVPGIDADCGGACACGTCHVILDSDWINTSSTTEAENQMLDLISEKVSSSRLSCQIPTSEIMDGMIVRLPEFQM